MPVIFNDHHQHTTFYRNSISSHDLHSKGFAETSEVIELRTGSMTFQNWCFDGYRLAHSLLKQKEQTTYEIKNDIDAVKIYFNRKGNTHTLYRQLSTTCTVKEGQYNIIYSGELDSQMSHTGPDSEIFSLQIAKELFWDLIREGSIRLGRFADRAADGAPALFSDQWLPMNWAMEKCINEIIHCHFARDLKKIYFRAKAMELFALFAAASQSDREKPPPGPVFVKNNADKEKLYFVRDYLIRYYADPASLSLVAKVSGLNEYKLKNGFRELFGTSVIDFLINHRLEQARDLLLNTGKNICEVAYETGYASPAYFSKAFKKKYGVSPKKSS
jgi:AraC-like DNA-binding protein